MPKKKRFDGMEGEIGFRQAEGESEVEDIMCRIWKVDVRKGRLNRFRQFVEVVERI